jgi:peptidoglycan L-alanyl-D-glutamate endopeptidase CwlK
MSFSLSEKSRHKLQGVHPDLVRVVERALEMATDDFTVGEGVRSLERQRELHAAGKSQTLKSKHLVQVDGYGHAVDLWVLVDGKVNWEMPRYKRLADVVLGAASLLGVNVEWGGNWHTFKDGPHFQLSDKGNS